MDKSQNPAAGYPATQGKKIVRASIAGFILLMGIFSPMRSQGQAALLILIFGDKVASENFHLSIDGGLNLSTLPGLDQGKTLVGVNFGLGTFIKLNDRWALAPEFKPLSKRGARDVKSILPVDVVLENPTTEFITNYIDIPLLVRYQISQSFFVSAGPQISFLTSANQRTRGTTTSGQEVVVGQDMKSLMHKESFMIPVELGYALSRQRGGKGVDLKVRYNIGVMEAFTATSLATSTNSTMQLMLSFPFINSTSEGK